MPDLSEEQEEAAFLMENFVQAGRGSGQQQLVVHGLAGTGKTTVLGAIGRKFYLPMCTLTGKAASVLREKSGLNAATIHSVFYDLVNDPKDDEDEYVPPEFVARIDHGIRFSGDVLLLDECSMINAKLANDILRSGARVIATGDPGQLPPVEGSQYFSIPDFTLRTIHRQALESPIIRQAHNVRKGLGYQPDGPDFRVLDTMPKTELVEADIIIVWRNATRRDLTKMIRELRGYARRYPQAGEPVMCLKNAPDYGIYNGAIYTLLEDFSRGDSDILLQTERGPTKIERVTFECIPRWFDGEVTTHFDFGYVITCHKAQGSEWNNVVIIDEYPPGWEHRREWIYTAITRAAKRVAVIPC